MVLKPIQNADFQITRSFNTQKAQVSEKNS